MLGLMEKMSEEKCKCYDCKHKYDDCPVRIGRVVECKYYVKVVRFGKVLR